MMESLIERVARELAEAKHGVSISPEQKDRSRDDAVMIGEELEAAQQYVTAIQAVKEWTAEQEDAEYDLDEEQEIAAADPHSVARFEREIADDERGAQEHAHAGLVQAQAAHDAGRPQTVTRMVGRKLQRETLREQLEARDRATVPLRDRIEKLRSSVVVKLEGEDLELVTEDLQDAHNRGRYVRFWIDIDTDQQGNVTAGGLKVKVGEDVWSVGYGQVEVR